MDLALRHIQAIKQQKAKLEAAVGGAHQTPKSEVVSNSKGISSRSKAFIAASLRNPAAASLRKPPGAPRTFVHKELQAKSRATASSTARRLGLPLRQGHATPRRSAAVALPTRNPIGEPPRKRARLDPMVKSENFESARLVKPKIEPARFGYGDSDDIGHHSMMNSRSKGKPQLVSRKSSGPDDPRSRNIVGRLLGHLASAKQNLADEVQIVKTKKPVQTPLGVARILVKRELHEPGRAGSSKTKEVVRLRRAAKRFPEKVEPPKRLPSPEEEREVPSPEEEREVPSPEEEQEVPTGRGDSRAQERQMTLLQHRLEAHYSLMKNFIRTRAEPTIFYLPVKHTKESKLSLQETREAIDQKVASLRSHLRSVDDQENSDDDDHYEPSEPNALSSDESPEPR